MHWRGRPRSHARRLASLDWLSSWQSPCSRLCTDELLCAEKQNSLSRTLPPEAEVSDVTAHSADGGSDDCEKPPARELLG